MKEWICFSQLLLLLVPSTITFAAERELAAQLRSGNVVLLIRHALAPGVGDPEELDLADCSTQRNLDAAGREQARAIGDWLRARNLRQVKVYSSQWCRCLETARLMDIGPVRPLPALNSFFERPADREPNLSALRNFIHENTKQGEVIIMVTHQVTISGITGSWTDSGHGRLVRPAEGGGIELLGELNFGE